MSFRVCKPWSEHLASSELLFWGSDGCIHVCVLTLGLCHHCHRHHHLHRWMTICPLIRWVGMKPTHLRFSVFRGIHRIACRFFGGMEDATIHFGQRLTISDFNDAQCLDEFRFRKEDLQLVADSLWPKIGLFLNGGRERIVMDNHYTAPYETCLLLTLYRYSQPRRLCPDFLREILWHEKEPLLCGHQDIF
jgi:hypothetical protein